ncbi:MAG: hypothetical protein KAI90_02345 [Desulfobulbaceae bacterium]|nr:hypothetical protein [Desulfobulbaceae bacterium]
MKPLVITVLIFISCMLSGCGIKTQCAEGDCVDGEGTMLFPDRSEYSGLFKDGQFTGNGTLTFPDGRTYKGEYKDYMPHGKGTIEFPWGYKYSGEFRNGEFTGRGYLIFPNDQKLKSHTKDGVFLDKDSFQEADVMPLEGEL